MVPIWSSSVLIFDPANLIWNAEEVGRTEFFAEQHTWWLALRLHTRVTTEARRRRIATRSLRGIVGSMPLTRLHNLVHVTALIASSALLGAGWKMARAEELPKLKYLNTRPGVQYVGDEACRSCHMAHYENFKRTGMGRSMAVPSLRSDLAEFARSVTVSKRLGDSYEVVISGGKVFHRHHKIDAQGKKIFSDTRELAYEVGSGERGRSYLVREGNFLFMSPLSYYTSTRRWDLSPGYESDSYRGFTRPIGDLCVFCHSGLPQPVAGTANQYNQPPFLFLTIGCERCHGPGELHVRQRLAGERLRVFVDPSIVNPSKLPATLRDNVCEQCHLAGDTRVLRPGKTYLDFRPGSYLDDTVAIFSVPPGLKGSSFDAIGQGTQMRMSRCWTASKRRLSCITCHDPHMQPRGAEVTAFFRSKCLACHTLQSCKLDFDTRRKTNPPDDCIGCHMPKRAVSTIAHTALTDHRILGRREAPYQANADFSSTDLIYETRRPDDRGDSPDLRTLALAYARLAESFPQYREKGFPLLERAARELPKDKDVQETYGFILLSVGPSPEIQRRAANSLERTIALDSKSALVRIKLAELRLQEGLVNRATTLLEEAISLEPYYAGSYFALGRIYLALNQRKRALELLQRAVKLDPDNDTAREQLRDARRLPP